MKKLLFAGAAVAALLAVPAMAQIGPDRQARQAGPLTRASVQAAVQSRFARVDSNHDGYVTRAEAEARATAARGEMRERFAERRGERRERMAQRGGEMRERMAERRAGMFDRLDTNKDGSISRAEFDAHHAARAERRGERDGAFRGRRGMAHARMMRRHHGGMARGMGPGMGGGRFGAAMFDRLDSDKDGRVSLAEASSRALAMFDNADANRDGTVTPEERRAAWQRFREDRRDGRRGG